MSLTISKFKQLFTGAINRLITSKMSDTISILDFTGVDSTGVSDSTAGIQAALDAAVLQHKTLYFPAGTYLVSALTYTAGLGLRLQGESSSQYTGTASGSVLKHTGSGALLTVDGSAGQANTIFDGLTFVGNTNSQHAITYTKATFITLQNCTFRDFTNATASAVYFTYPTPGQFTGVVKILNCNWVFCTVGVFADKVSFNYYVFHTDSFLACGNAIKMGVATVAFDSSKVAITQCQFEGNTGYDIYSAGGAQALSIDDNYFEQPVGGSASQCIYIDNNVSSTVNSAISICRNFFAKQLLNANNSVIFAGQTYNLTVKDNFNAYGGSNDRFFVDGPSTSGGSKNWDVDVCASSSTVTPYPNRIDSIVWSLNNRYPTNFWDAKAWVRFAGASGNILDSYGVASVVRNSTGNYTVTLSKAMTNVNYTTSITSVATLGVEGNSRTTTVIPVLTYNLSAAATDPTDVAVVVFGR